MIKSGRRKAQVMEDARLIGQSSYIYEVGSGLVIDGEVTFLTGDWQPREGETIHEQIEESGAPELLLATTRAGSSTHTPWHLDREVSHLFRGLVDTVEADELLAEQGTAGCGWSTTARSGRSCHGYHLIPRGRSKAAAVTAHMRARGYAPGECIAVGDSREDLDVAEWSDASSSWPTRRRGDTSRLPQRRAHRGAPWRGLLRGRGEVLSGVALSAGVIS